MGISKLMAVTAVSNCFRFSNKEGLDRFRVWGLGFRV
jgi:hypothetical protein